MKNLLFTLLLFPVFVTAQNNNATPGNDSAFIRQLANTILKNRYDAYNNLGYLTKNIGARLAGSPQMPKAEQWGAKALQQAGADEVKMQECMVPHWVRGGRDKATITYTNSAGKKVTDSIAVLAIGNTVGTGAKGVNAPLIRVHSFEELEQRKNEIKGKIVFYTVPFEDSLVQTFEAYGKNVVYRGIGASRAAKYGALAVLVRSMTNSVDNYPHTGALHYIDSLPKIPAADVGLRDVEKMDSLFDEQKTMTAQLFTNGHFLPDTIGHNVIGILKGQDDSVITVGGHLDSWDVNEGATDDGAGIVQTIEILRALKAMGYQPKHTIHFVLFANEENGTRGGNKYADEAKANNVKHVFALESDAGGFTPRGFSITAPEAAWPKINSWKALLYPYGGDDLVHGGAGTDVTPINKALGTPVAELRPDSQRYFDVHHAVNDVFENVNIRELKLGAVNMAALIYLVDKYGL